MKGYGPAAATGEAADVERLRRLGLALALGVAGTLLHDLVEFGRPSPENGVPVTVLFSILFVAWWAWRRARRVLEAVLVVLAAILLLGGAVGSVLPLAVWPFVPERTPTHHVTHLLWSLSLAAMIWMVVRPVRRMPAP